MTDCPDPGCPCQAPSPLASAVAVVAASEARTLAAAKPELFPLAQQWSAYTGMTLADSLDHFGRLLGAFQEAIAEVFASGPYADLQARLRDAGLIPEEPPADPRDRALLARRHRSTGPPRPAAGHARRPRNHPGNSNLRGL